jgi:hypothetical protein
LFFLGRRLVGPKGLRKNRQEEKRNRQQESHGRSLSENPLRRNGKSISNSTLKNLTILAKCSQSLCKEEKRGKGKNGKGENQLIGRFSPFPVFPFPLFLHLLHSAK